jgi:hypothetical protein
MSIGSDVGLELDGMQAATHATRRGDAPVPNMPGRKKRRLPKLDRRTALTIRLARRRRRSLFFFSTYRSALRNCFPRACVCWTSSSLDMERNLVDLFSRLAETDTCCNAMTCMDGCKTADISDVYPYA